MERLKAVAECSKFVAHCSSAHELAHGSSNQMSQVGFCRTHFKAFREFSNPETNKTFVAFGLPFNTFRKIPVKNFYPILNTILCV